MPCYKPLDGWQKVGGGWTASRHLSNTMPMSIPCGRCVGCRTDRKNEWALRLVHEARDHEESCFITLTYHDQALPYGGTLVKKHAQDFLKRLRRRLEPRKIRFFLVGEYGDKLSRPHYHAIIYGWKPHDGKFHKKNRGKNLYISPFLESVWGHGFVQYGDADPEACKYVSHYVVKKFTGPDAERHYTVLTEYGELVSRVPEFAHMSTRPGIGAGTYERYKRDYRNSDFALLLGRKVKIPRYYDKLLQRENESALDAVKASRRKKARSPKRRADNTPERLAVREQVAKSKTNYVKRNQL